MLLDGSFEPPPCIYHGEGASYMLDGTSRVYVGNEIVDAPAGCSPSPLVTLHNPPSRMYRRCVQLPHDSCEILPPG